MKPNSILELEKALGIILNPLESGDVIGFENKDCFLLDENNEVIGLNLWFNHLTDISVLSSLKNLESLDLSFNALTEISVLGSLGKLTTLNLRYNQLSYISVLGSLVKLETLDLSCNPLSDISVLGSLGKLTRLNLSDNQLNNISVLGSLEKLETLDLSDNQLSDISVLGSLEKLTRLYLNDNQLSDISVLGSLKKLTTLHLSINQLSDISVLGSLEKLEILDLSANQLSDISVLGSLEKLTTLNLSTNQFSDISVLGSLEKLETLNLNDNQLSDISVLGSLKKLTRLHLSINQLSDISVLGSLEKLTSLDLSINQLSDISVLGSLEKLTSLDLIGNKLTDISILGSLGKLTTLDLSNNELSDISVLGSLEQLTTLYLSNNELSDISVLGSLRELTTLHLNNNHLSDISVLGSLRKLTSLYLISNQLSDISILCSLEKLTSLYLNDNQLSDLNSIKDIIKINPFIKEIYLKENPLPIPTSLLNDIDGLRAYFKDAETGVSSKRNTKLLFLGDGCVGKSTLLEHLKTLEIPKEISIDKRTEGIQLDIWKDVLPDIKVNVWDFGGQEVMHSTHRLFLGEQAVYVLVWCKQSNKKCSESETHNLQYWLDFIADYGRKSIVLLVENVINNEFDNQEFPDDEEFSALVEKYKEKQIELISSQYRFDCKNNTDEVESFRDVIKNKIKSLHRKYPIENYPLNWHDFQELLEEEKEKHKTISLEHFVELGNKVAVSDPKALISFFDRTGIIGYYESLANDTIILQMDWVLEAVYASVRLKDNPLRRTNGKLIDTDFDSIWSSYTSEERTLFKQYMLKSNLLSYPNRYSHSNREYTYLCPALFKEKDAQSIDWAEKESYVVVQFNFVFGAIMQQLQVRVLSHCHYEENEVFYKNYICFKSIENAQVWVEMLEQEKELRIYSKSQKIIQTVLNEINEIYPLNRTAIALRNNEGAEEEYQYAENDKVLFDSEERLKKESILKEKEDMEDKKPIKVFVTYSWTDESGHLDEAHQNKVGVLVDQLRARWNMDASFDLMTEENNFIKMMYQNLHTNDKVIIVLSEGYAEKATAFKNSGVTTEYERIINDINENPKKYILVAFDERKKEKVPFGFQGDDVIVLKEALKVEDLTDNQNRLLAKLTDQTIVEISDLSGVTPAVRKRKFKY